MLESSHRKYYSSRTTKMFPTDRLEWARKSTMMQNNNSDELWRLLAWIWYECVWSQILPLVHLMWELLWLIWLLFTTGITTKAVEGLAWQLALLVLVRVNVYIDAFTRDGQHKPLTTHHQWIFYRLHVLYLILATYQQIRKMKSYGVSVWVCMCTVRNILLSVLS